MSMSPNFVLIMALEPFAPSAFPSGALSAAKRAPIPSNRLPLSRSVTATDNLGGEYVTATVEVKGLHASCLTTKSETFAIKPGCPSFKLETPPAPVEEGQLAILTANVSGSGAQHVTFYWMVSAGKIRRGQATAAIEVDTSKLGGVGILAAVELGGLAPACRTSEVVAVMIAKKAGKKAKARAVASQ